MLHISRDTSEHNNSLLLKQEITKSMLEINFIF